MYFVLKTLQPGYGQDSSRGVYVYDHRILLLHRNIGVG